MEKMSSRLENQNVTRLNKTQLITKLIRLYQANECLWNPKSPGYHNLALKENAWRRISYFFKDDRLTVEQLKLMIISLRYYYERERLAIIANKLNGVYYAPRHSYYNKLHFMNPENETLKVLMSQARACNKQISRIVEDTFLVDNQRSIHSGYADGSPFTMNENNVCHNVSASLSFSDKASYCSILPSPPIEFQKFQLRQRSVSGCDRLDPNGCSCRNSSDVRKVQNRQTRPPPQDYNNELDPNDHMMASTEINDNDEGSINERYIPVQPKRKVLTGRYGPRPQNESNWMPNYQHSNATSRNCRDGLCQRNDVRNDYESPQTVKESLDINRNCREGSCPRCDARNDYETPQTSSRSPPNNNTNNNSNYQDKFCGNNNCTEYIRRGKPQNEQEEFYSAEPTSEDHNSVPCRSYGNENFTDNDQPIQMRRPKNANTVIGSRDHRDSRPLHGDLQAQYENDTGSMYDDNDGVSRQMDYDQKQSPGKDLGNCDKRNCPVLQGQKARDFQIFIRPSKSAKVRREEMLKELQNKSEDNSTHEDKRMTYMPMYPPDDPIEEMPPDDNEFDNVEERSYLSKPKKTYCSKRSNVSRHNDVEYDDGEPTCPQRSHYTTDNSDVVYVECQNSKIKGREMSYKDFDNMPENKLKRICSDKSNRNNSQLYKECPASRQRSPARDDNKVYDAPKGGASKESKMFYSCSNRQSKQNIKVSEEYIDSLGSNRTERGFANKDFEHDDNYNDPEIVYCTKNLANYVKCPCTKSKGNQQNRSRKYTDLETEESAEMINSSRNVTGSNYNKPAAKPQYNEASVETDIDMTLTCRNRELCRTKSIPSTKKSPSSNNRVMGPQYSQAWVETDIDMNLHKRNMNICQCGSKPQQTQSNTNDNSLDSDTKQKKENLFSPIIASVSAAKAKVKSPPKKLKPVCRCTPPVFNKNKYRTSSQAPRVENPTKQRAAPSWQGKTRASSQKRDAKLEEDTREFQEPEDKLMIHHQTIERPRYQPREYQKSECQECSRNSRRYRHGSSSDSDDSIRFFNQYTHLVDNHGQMRNKPAMTQREFIKRSYKTIKNEIIILHPPVKNFHPSMYSIDLRDRR